MSKENIIYTIIGFVVLVILGTFAVTNVFPFTKEYAYYVAGFITAVGTGGEVVGKYSKIFQELNNFIISLVLFIIFFDGLSFLYRKLFELVF